MLQKENVCVSYGEWGDGIGNDSDEKNNINRKK